MQRLSALAAIALIAIASGAAADEEIDRIQAVWRQRLDGRHFTAKVRMWVQLDARTEERSLLVWRDDVDATRERLYARFESPEYLRDLALLYLENPARSNDYFIYQPSTERIRRVSERIASQDIYGVDLEFLGFGLAQTVESETTSVEYDDVDGRRAVRIEERPTQPNPRFDRRLTWIDVETLLPLRTEHHHRGRLRLVGRTLRFSVVQGLATPIEMIFERESGYETVRLEIERIDYETPIPRDYFTTLRLIQ